MKILILNGSPREGNTKFALKIINDSINQNVEGAQTDVLDVADMGISGCIGCNSCISNSGACVFDDDMTDVIKKVREADIIIFGTPVYWWGITAQLKLVIDRMFALSGDPGKKDKRIGLLAIGEDKLSGVQYELISKQFECISKHLGWEMIFDKAISAAKPDDVSNDKSETDDLASLWKNI